MSETTSTLLANGEGGASSVIVGVIGLGVIVLMIAGIWKAFEKAGEPGWASIVPIYNMIVMCRIAGRPEWWFLLFLIPCVGIVFAILVAIDFAKAYGKDAGYAIGLILLPFIFYPMLGFGDARYVRRPARQPAEEWNP